jgi:hypothetical protein
MKTNATHLEPENPHRRLQQQCATYRLVCAVYPRSPESLYSSAQLPFYVDFPKGNP